MVPVFFACPGPEDPIPRASLVSFSPFCFNLPYFFLYGTELNLLPYGPRLISLVFQLPANSFFKPPTSPDTPLAIRPSFSIFPLLRPPPPPSQRGLYCRPFLPSRFSCVQDELAKTVPNAKPSRPLPRGTQGVLHCFPSQFITLSFLVCPQHKCYLSCLSLFLVPFCRLRCSPVSFFFFQE